jgi:hypothetical protein
MRSRKGTRYPLLMAVVLATGAAQVSGGFRELTLAVSSSVDRVLPLEPFPITITLTNETRAPIVACAWLRPGHGALMRLYVQREGGAVREFDPCGPWPFGSVNARERPLAPGERVEEKGMYLYFTLGDEAKAPGYLFPEPGEYWVWGVFSSLDQRDTVQSKKLKVDVLEPDNENRDAYEFLRGLSPATYRDFLTREFWTANREAEQTAFLEKAEECLDRFPASRYSGYLRLTVGQAYVRGMGKGRTVGVAMLEETARKGPELFQSPAWKELVRVACESSELDKARDYLKALEAKDPRGGLTDWARSQLKWAEKKAGKTGGESG